MVGNEKWYRDEDTGRYVFNVSVIVNAPVDVCFVDWANFESFPKLMRHVTHSRKTGDNNWHWEATVSGRHAEWEARTVEYRPNEVISWESTSGLRNSGSVYFTPEGRGCRVAVQLAYDPPFGFIGDLVAERSINDQFHDDLQEDLENFKRNVESGRAEDFRRAA